MPIDALSQKLMELSQQIDLLPIPNQENVRSIDNNLVQSTLNDIFANFDSLKTVNDNRLKQCFGRLNFRAKLLQQSNLLPKGADTKISAIAREHGIERMNYRLDRIRNIVRQVTKMIGQPGPTLGELHPQYRELRRAKPLSDDYWKEFVDSSHRHPKVLEKLFNEWKVYGKHESMSFWEHLQKTEEAVTASEHPESIVYLNEEQRKAYRCTLEMVGEKIILKDASGQPLKPGLYITVLGPDCKFYAAKKEPGKFQHASFFSGKAVITAGMFLVEQDGTLKNFISHSGHYKPEKLEMYKALYYMEKAGVDVSKLKLIYSIGEEQVEIQNPKEWQEYQDFLAGRLVKMRLQADENLMSAIKKEAPLIKSFAQVALKLGGGLYNEKLHAVVPISPSRVSIELERTKNQIARAIGPLPNPPSRQSMLWQNAASSEKALLQHAHQLAPSFRDFVHVIAKEVKGSANFGPDGTAIVKAESSLHRKVEQDARVMGISSTDSLAVIGDALRGTLIVDNPEQISEVARSILKHSVDNGWEVVFKNLWEQNNPHGYAAIHAKILMPIAPGSNEKIIVELQIHLRRINDGTQNCVKEYSHHFYDLARTGAMPLEELTNAARLMYLTAMQAGERHVGL